MKKNIKKIWVLVMAVSFAGTMISCGNKENAGTSASETEEPHEENENLVEINQAQYQSIGIQLGSAEKKAISGLLKVSGFIDVPPQNLVSVTTQMGGIIKSTPLLQGSNVRKEQVIAVLENQDYVQLQQDYLESKSQLELSQAEYERQKALASQNVNSQKTLQQAKSQFQVSQARESALRERLSLINIGAAGLQASNIRSRINVYSPVSGYVTKVNVNEGKFVNPNDVMFEIVDGSSLHVELNVFEKDAILVKPGQRVRFRLSGEKTEAIAYVKLVGKEIREDKTVTVHAAAEGSDSYIPGTYLQALIETGTKKATVLPEEAIVDFDGKKYIFVKSEAPEESSHEGKEESRAEGERKDSVEKTALQPVFYFEMVEISVGNSDGGYVQVNLPAGQDFEGKIVTNGTYDLLSKLKNSEEHSGH